MLRFRSVHRRARPFGVPLTGRAGRVECRATSSFFAMGSGPLSDGASREYQVPFQMYVQEELWRAGSMMEGPHAHTAGCVVWKALGVRCDRLHRCALGRVSAGRHSAVARGRVHDDIETACTGGTIKAGTVKTCTSTGRKLGAWLASTPIKTLEAASRPSNRRERSFVCVFLGAKRKINHN